MTYTAPSSYMKTRQLNKVLHQDPHWSSIYSTKECNLIHPIVYFGCQSAIIEPFSNLMKATRFWVFTKKSCCFIARKKKNYAKSVTFLPNKDTRGVQNASLMLLTTCACLSPSKTFICQHSCCCVNKVWIRCIGVCIQLQSLVQNVPKQSFTQTNTHTNTLTHRPC